MQWVDEAIVLGVRRHGEASAILEWTKGIVLGEARTPSSN